MLNLGCGARVHPSFINVDHVARNPGVITHDLKCPLPFPDGRFDVVYHSHVLEHLPRGAAPAFLGECNRVLRTGGILRVVVPDLEQIAALYLESLRRAAAGEPGWAERYDWMLIELIDQLGRHRSGGAMQEYLTQDALPAREFVLARMGAEARGLIESRPGRGAARASLADAVPGWSALRGSVRRMRQLARSPRAFIASELLGPDRTALDVGRFRLSGEVHLWMYDRYSLARLLRECGFVEPRKVEAAQSEVPGWAAYDLDTEPDGSVYKPDSLFMEARRD